MSVSTTLNYLIAEITSCESNGSVLYGQTFSSSKIKNLQEGNGNTVSKQ